VLTKMMMVCVCVCVCYVCVCVCYVCVCVSSGESLSGMSDKQLPTQCV
jgi:hypothetical protein